MVRLVLFLAAALCPSFAAADEEEFSQHDFLFLLEEAYTQEAGEPQVGLSFDYGFDDKDWALEAEFEYGITERLQVFVEAPLENAPGADFDIGDIEFGVDYALLKDNGAGAAPELTIGVAASAPTGGPGPWRLEPSVRLSKRIATPLYLHAGVAAEINTENDDGVTLKEWAVGGGIGWRAGESVTFTAEYLREAEAEEELSIVSREAEHLVAASASYELLDDFLIGAALSQAVSGGDETRLIIKFQVER